MKYNVNGGAEGNGSERAKDEGRWNRQRKSGSS